MQRNTVISLVVVVLLIAGGWYFFSQKGGNSTSSTVATVNGEVITSAELESTQVQLAREQGADFAGLTAEQQTQVRQQALEVLISRILLEQAAETSGSTASQAQVDEQITTIRGQFADEAAFNTALQTEGLTETTLREQVKRDLTIRAYLNQTLNLGSLTATDAEVNQAYAQATANMEDAPPLEEVREQVVALVVGQKEQALIAAHVQELRADAEVEVLI